MMMPGHRPFREIRRGDDDPVRVVRVNALRREAEEEQEAYARTLAELRRARAYTQEQLAASLDVPQSQVSRMERQADLYVSTLVRYVEAMGGQVEIVATFEDGGARVPLVVGDLLSRPAGEIMGSRAEPTIERGAGRDIEQAIFYTLNPDVFGEQSDHAEGVGRETIANLHGDEDAASLLREI